MDHPFYKTWLSYLTDISLEKTSSSYNQYLEVRLVQGRHQLITEDAVYSFDDKYLNFYETFKSFNWERKEINSILLLGLGLGSVIYILENIIKIKPEYTAVEIDPEICRLAQKYTLHKLESYVQVYTTDGIKFLEQNGQKFDLIIMDIFQSAIIPEKYQTDNYIELLQDNLAKEGCILYNTMNISDTDKKNNELFRKTFINQFKNPMEFPVYDNIVFISDSHFMVSDNP